MSNPSLFARITKVDEEKRLIHTRIIKEENDKADEIFDYESSVPHFKEWSAENFKHSGGKSYGNVRAMHGKSLAGVFAEPLKFSDAEKAIDGVIHCVDDQDWKKVLAGGYTGVSIGGSYVGDRKAEKSADGRDVHRYTAKPIEVSLVDSPCVPSARFFDIIKSDGHVEKKEFQTMAKLGEVQKVVTEPIDVAGTNEEVAAFGKALNDKKLSMTDALEALNLLVAKRAEKPVEKTEDEKIIEKAIAIGALVKRVSDPDLALVDLADIAKTELTDDERKPLKTLDDVRKAIIAKVSGSMSAANKDRLQAAHDHLQAMGAACGADKSDQGGDLSKADVAALAKRVAQLEAQPAPHVVLRTIAKTVGNDPDKPKDDVKKYPDGHLAKFQRPDGTIDFDAADRALTKAA